VRFQVRAKLLEVLVVSRFHRTKHVDCGNIRAGESALVDNLFNARAGRSDLSAQNRQSAWAITIIANPHGERRLTDNVDLRHVPVAFTTDEAFASSDYLNAVRESTFDVIIVDGSEWTLNARPICFRAAEQQIAPGGIIVVDDSWRYRELRQAYRAKRVEIFESVGPARYGVTSTDVYFY
jgi:hypothetical protein